MATNQSGENLNLKAPNQMVAFLLIGATLIIGFFYTWDAYTAYLGNQDSLTKTTAEKNEKIKTLATLNMLAEKTNTDAVLKDNLERYAGTFREDAILDSIFAKGSNVSISSISLDKGGKLPNGLSMADISLSLSAPDLITLNAFLDYLTEKKENKKSYVIKSLSFPYDSTKNESVNVALDLGMYYFD